MSNSNKSKTHYLYELRVRGDVDPFYIGRTCDPANRKCKHFKDAFTVEKHLPKAKKIIKVLAEGGVVELNILRESSTFSEVCEWERELIDHYGRRDIETGVLLNLTDGGDGHENYVWSDEARKRKSEQMMGSALNLGRSRPDMVERMSKSVHCYNREGYFVASFSSQKEAAIEMLCNEMSIGKNILGKARGVRSKRDGLVYQFSREKVANIMPIVGSFQGDPKPPKVYKQTEEHRKKLSASIKRAKARSSGQPCEI